jgi:hypothetical protein
MEMKEGGGVIAMRRNGESMVPGRMYSNCCSRSILSEGSSWVILLAILSHSTALNTVHDIHQLCVYPYSHAQVGGKRRKEETHLSRLSQRFSQISSHPFSHLSKSDES